MTNLVVLAGMPGSGRTTWAKSLLYLKYAIVSEEGDKLKDTLNLNLTHNIDTVVDSPNLSRTDRHKLLAIAGDCNANAHLILFKNVQEALSRVDLDPIVWQLYSQSYYDTLAEVVQEPWDSVTKIESYR